MRLHFGLGLVISTFLSPIVLAQSSSSASGSGSASASPSASASNSGASSTSSSGSASTSASASASVSATSANSTFNVITTTITSLVSSGTASPSTSTLVLTLTLNTTANSNVTHTNTTVGGNSTLPAGNGTTNGTTNATAAWNATDQWLPFSIPIDPAYGVLGGVLILSGLPVAVLGGKNRWSSLAISTGYCLMLFTLIMILRFGVEPDLQPPSPQSPSWTLRGLYLLACVISALFGCAIGIFLYKFAKYWVCAAGGFAFAWFLMACRAGGLVGDTVGRWGLFGGMAVAWFLGGLPNSSNSWMVLISTAWLGATAFTLGIDCYIRAGLKEFYIYNLGFYALFPSLNGNPYPLTQLMAIELGILGAVILIGASIQFRLLNVLQKRLKQMREEEEARIEAEEVAKAAERFKNVGTDLKEWEEKHGTGAAAAAGASGSGLGLSLGRSVETSDLPADRASVVLPQLDFEEGEGRASSQLSLLGQDKRGGYEPVALGSPTGQTSQAGRSSPIESLRSPVDSVPSPTTAAGDPDWEGKIRLLEEIKKARSEVRSSIDLLDKLRIGSPTASSIQGANSRSATPVTLIGHQRSISGASSQLLQSADKLGAASASASVAPVAPAPPQSEWDTYLQDRKIIAPTARSVTADAAVPALEHQARPQSQYAAFDTTSRGVGVGVGPSTRRSSMMTLGREEMIHDAPQVPYTNAPQRTASTQVLPRPSTFHEMPSAPIITGSAARPTDTTPHSGSGSFSGGRRTMTYEELSERHRKRMSQMQNPVTDNLREDNVEEARERWEKQKQKEKEEMRKREAEKAAKAKVREGSDGSGGSKKARDKEEVMKSTDQWRRSVPVGLSEAAVGKPSRPTGQEPGKSKSKGDGARRSSKHFAS